MGEVASFDSCAKLLHLARSEENQYPTEYIGLCKSTCCFDISCLPKQIGITVAWQLPLLILKVVEVSLDINTQKKSVHKPRIPFLSPLFRCTENWVTSLDIAASPTIHLSEDHCTSHSSCSYINSFLWMQSQC